MGVVLGFAMKVGGSAGPQQLQENVLALAMEKGEFRKSNLGEFITEELEFLSHLKLNDCTYFAAHMLNPVQLVGSLPNDKERMLGELWSAQDYYSKKGMLSYQMNF